MQTIFIENTLLAYGNGFKSVVANNWLMSFEVSLITSITVLFYFGIRLLIFTANEKRLGANNIEVFAKRSPSLDLLKVNESVDRRLLSPSAHFFVSSRYTDQNTITREKFLSLFGNVITVEYTENSYIIDSQQPLGFYMFLLPWIIPVGYLIWVVITAFSFGQPSFSTAEFSRACFFSPVFSAFFAGFITIFEGST
jgi:hypothetical protein